MNFNKYSLLKGVFIAATALGIFWLYSKPSTEIMVLTPKAQIALGAKVYKQNCASCHGANGEGENVNFVKGGAKVTGGYWAPALNGTAHSWHHPPRVIKSIITDGSIAEDSQMRGFKGSLSEQEIQSVITYFQSLWPEKIRQRYNQIHSSTN